MGGARDVLVDAVVGERGSWTAAGGCTTGYSRIGHGWCSGQAGGHIRRQINKISALLSVPIKQSTRWVPGGPRKMVTTLDLA